MAVNEKHNLGFKLNEETGKTDAKSTSISVAEPNSFHQEQSRQNQGKTPNNLLTLAGVSGVFIVILVIAVVVVTVYYVKEVRDSDDSGAADQVCLDSNCVINAAGIKRPIVFTSNFFQSTF